MENKINIENILRDCPMYTKLYSPLFGTVELLSIGDGDYDKYPISVRTKEKGSVESTQTSILFQESINNPPLVTAGEQSK